MKSNLQFPNGDAPVTLSEVVSTLGDYVMSVNNISPEKGNVTLDAAAVGAAPESHVSDTTVHHTISELKTEWQSDIATSVSSVFKYKGAKSTLTEVESVTNKAVGDVWSVGNEEYVWNGTTWELLGTTVDLSGYLTSAEAATTYLSITSAASTYATSSMVSSHTGNKDIHVTASDKTTWNSKAPSNHSHTWTVNGKNISSNPVLNGADIALTGYSYTPDQDIAHEDDIFVTTDTINSAFSKVELMFDRVNAGVTDVAQLFNIHVQNLDIHVTSGDKTKWNDYESRIDALESGTYDDTELRGLISNKADASTVATHISNTTIHVTASDKNNWNNKADDDHVHPNVLTYRGSKSSYADLGNVANPAVGDVYVVGSAEYVCTSVTGSVVWTELGAPAVDLSSYLTVTVADGKYAASNHNHDSKYAPLSLSTTVSEHKDNDIRHITASERSKWDAKATSSDIESDIAAHNSAESAHTELVRALTSQLDGKANTDHTHSVYALKSEISAVFRYKGSKASYAEVTAITNRVVGDVWHVTGAGTNGSGAEYVWTGTAWEELGTTVSMDVYDAHVNNGEKHVTTSDKSNWNSKASASDISDAISAHNTNQDAHEALVDGLTAMIDGKADTSTVSSIRNRVSNIESTLSGLETILSEI